MMGSSNSIASKSSSWCVLLSLFVCGNRVESYRVGSRACSGLLCRTHPVKEPARVVTQPDQLLFSPRFCMATSSRIAPQNEVYAPVTIVSNEPEAEGLRLVRIEVPQSLTRNFQHPGQYVKIKLANNPEHKPSYFAICSAPLQCAALARKRAAAAVIYSQPSAPTSCIFTFLIKDIPLHHFVLEAPLFQPGLLEMSIPIGKGFPILEKFYKIVPTVSKTDNEDTFYAAVIKEVLLFATGSGIAPILSVLESKILTTLATNQLEKIKLYVGCRTPHHIPCQPIITRLQDQYPQLEVIPVISQPEHPWSSEWSGYTGYVQDILRQDGIRYPETTGVLLCGQR
jgi:NAD(P)H-flavin reductase